MTGRAGPRKPGGWDLAGKRALVTGAAGAFGSSTLDHLRRRVYPGYVPTPIHDASLARGVDLGLFLPAETVDQVVATILKVAAAPRPPRNQASTRATGFGVAVARHLPSVADRVVRWRTNQQARKGGLGELTGRLGKI